MSGNRYFLDTNAVIALLSGNKAIEEMLNEAEWVGISSISVIEFFAFPELSFNDRLLFTSLLDRIEVVALTADAGFLESLAFLKIESNLKLPDAIISGYAIQLQAILLSNDRHFENINKLKLQKF